MKVIKRDGQEVYFDQKKIELAITKAALETGEMLYKDIFAVTTRVARGLAAKDETHEVEYIQDCVENELMSAGFQQTAKAYILYRAKRTEERNET